jgi:DNA primase
MDPIDQIKQKIDIADLIGDYITLKKAGSNFKGLCPFHGEKTPSFVVSPERQVWHCFGCQKGGDHFTFIEEIEGIGFTESLKLLAEKAGVKLVTTPFRSEAEDAKNTLFEINHRATSYYNYILTKHKVGKIALLYLTNERKVNEKLIETFMLGYAPNSFDGLTNYLIKKGGYNKAQLINAGLVTERNGRLFDFFRNRIIFPIQDPRGNIIGFSGRVFGDENSFGPKYINTRETLVYKKSYSLFGINFTKDYIKKEGKAILMEGEFDVLSSIANGISNVVAIKGTALTEEQINLLKRFTKKIVFCFDTDIAGIEAQKRSIQLIEEEGISSAVVIPPHGKDPDELLRTSPAEFKIALKNEKSVYDFIIEQAIKEENKKTIEGKKNILNKTRSFLKGINNEIVKEHYIKKLSNLLDSSFESVSAEIEKAPAFQVKKTTTVSKVILSHEEALEQHLLALIIQSENPYESLVLAESIVKPTHFQNGAYEKIFNHLNKYFKTSNKFEPEKFAKGLESELTNAFNLSYLKPLPKFETDIARTKDMERTAYEIVRLSLKRKLKALASRIKDESSTNDEKKAEKLQKEFTNTANELKKISQLS